MSFRDTLRQGALADLDFTNDDFETALRANYAASDNLTVASIAVERKAEETGMDLDTPAEAVIKFGKLFKGTYRKLDTTGKAEIQQAFADLYPDGDASGEIEALFNAYVEFQATSGDVVEVGDALLEEEPPVDDE